MLVRCFIIATTLLAHAAASYAQGASPVQEQRRRWEEPINLVSLNTASDDFAPAWSGSEQSLYFSSTENGYAQFFTGKYELPSAKNVAVRDASFRFSARELVKSTLNAPRNNQSFITFANDGNVYFSTFRQTKRRPYLNIFQAARRSTNLASGLWEKPDHVLALNTDGFNAHPTVSPSGKFIVFSSDRAGSRGGTDLWIAVRDENGEWQPPVNIGDVLNSIGDEISPFFAANDSLYFASNGFGGKGGFEIFLTVRSAGKWQSPVPVVDLNSEFDDYDFTMLPGNVGVFASNRPGGRGGIDLYASKLSAVALNVSAVEYKVTAQTTFLTVEEFATTDVLPVLPCVFFADNTAALPSDLKQLATQEETAQYSTTTVRPDQLGIYAETLNVLGKRMSDFPEAALILTPYVPESPSPRQTELAKARAEAIRKYLARVWRVEQSRIITTTPRSVADMLPTPGVASKKSSTLQTTMLGSNERSRCVEFSSSDARVLSPIKIGSVNALSKTQRLETSLDARPRDLVRSWVFSATAGNDTLVVLDGATLPHTLNIPLSPETLNRVTGEIRLRLAGVDSLRRDGKGEMLVTVFRIPISEKRTKKVADKIVERHRILLLDEAQNDLTAEQKDYLRSIATTLTPAATLTVSGFGSDVKKSNAQIEQFVSIIADELKRLVQNVANVSIQPEFLGDSDTLLSASPQERLYARSITITVERTLSPQEKR